MSFCNSLSFCNICGVDKSLSPRNALFLVNCFLNVAKEEASVLLVDGKSLNFSSICCILSSNFLRISRIPWELTC